VKKHILIMIAFSAILGCKQKSAELSETSESATAQAEDQKTCSDIETCSCQRNSNEKLKLAGTKRYKNCYSLENTFVDDIEWLESYRENPVNLAEGQYFLVSCPLTTADRSNIINKCEKENSSSDKFICVSKEARKKITDIDKFVCRHFSKCVYQVMKEMGIKTNYETGASRIDGESKLYHAWVEMKVGAMRHMADALNGYFYFCPIRDK
jgi:hypothetical protein